MSRQQFESVAIIRNPNSTGAARSDEVLTTLDRYGIAHTDFMTSSPDTEQNIAELQEFTGSLPDNSAVISAAGDGTAMQLVNAVARNRIAERETGKPEKQVTLGFMPYGGFGDIDHAHNAHGDTILDVLDAPTVTRRPLTVEVDGEYWRHVPAYFSLGFTALAAASFGEPLSREKMQRTPAALKRARQVLQLGQAYFHYRDQRLPRFMVNGDSQIHERSTDIIVANNSYIGGMIKPTERYYDGPSFGYRADIDVSRILPNVPFGLQALAGRAPFERATELRIAFERAADLTLHNEGETELRSGVNEIFVYKNPADAIRTLHPRSR